MVRKHTKFINLSEGLVSIITPVFNRIEWLPLTLQSLVDQTYSNWECILVNDFGEDVQHIVNQFNDPRIKYFKNDRNEGLAQTRNNAIDKSSGDYFISLDSDDQLYSEAIEFRMGLIKKHNFEVVYTRALKNIYEKQQNSYRLVQNILYWDSPFPNKDLILVQNTCPCNCLMWSRKAQDFGGYYDPTLSTGEDWNHSIAMSRKYDFWESKVIDCQCSYRTDGNQMTGTRDFSRNTAKIFKTWRHTAQDLDWVITNQTNILKMMNLNPSEFGL
jgi:glycosyltransferase involved in cell wall biosynthesis